MKVQMCIPWPDPFTSADAMLKWMIEAFEPAIETDGYILLGKRDLEYIKGAYLTYQHITRGGDKE